MSLPKNLLNHLSDCVSLFVRNDITSKEKSILFLQFLVNKFWQGSKLKFLKYSVRNNSRTNTLGILKEVFLRGDYAFKPESTTPRIIDAGANIGISVLFFKHYFPKAKVTAFEASSENFKVLTANISDNKFPNVEAVFGALGNETGIKSFYFSPESPGGSTAISDVVASKKVRGFVAEEVPAIKLSTYINEDVDLLKMDVEGAEGDILLDLEQSGKIKFVKQMVFEYHANDANKTNELSTLLECLKRNGFSVVIYDNERGESGRKLKKLPFYHFMIRAYKK